jgi:ABC-2 type transport system permease protein
MNLVASTSLSREGQTFWVSKMIPVLPRIQIAAKYLQAYSVSFLSVLITSILLALFFKFGLLRVLIIFGLGLLGSIPLTALNLVIDVLRPKLVWTNPQEAIKQNLNGLLGMLISIIILLVLGAGAVFLISAKTPVGIIYGLIVLVLLLLSVPSMIWLFTSAEKTYHRIEI